MYMPHRRTKTTHTTPSRERDRIAFLDIHMYLPAVKPSSFTPASMVRARVLLHTCLLHPVLNHARKMIGGTIAWLGLQEYPPSGSRVEAAPECVSVVFDESGLVTKITGGYCLDRGMGNTGPAGGIWGVLQVGCWCWWRCCCYCCCCC